MNEQLINQLVTKLTEAIKPQIGSWILVQEKARAYAQLEAHGTVINNHGSFVHVNESERKQLLKFYAEEVLRAIRIAYTEDAVVGAVIHDAVCTPR